MFGDLFEAVRPERAEGAAGGPGFQRAAAELSRRIQRSLSLRVPVQAVGAGTLPRFELKARRWRRL
jgi:phenylacetate-coenzyme A ligase PaaK-like adenylate-forming protein